MQQQNNPCIEEDEIDLKELFVTLWKRRVFITVFTLLITLIAAVYAFVKTPVYEVKASLQTGYVHNNSNHIINPYALKIYIDSNYGKIVKKELPYTETRLAKGSRSIIDLTIFSLSNQQGKSYLLDIIKDINSQEDKKLSSLIKNIKDKINIYNHQLSSLTSESNNLKKELNKQKDPQIYQALLQSIKEYSDQILNAKLNILNLKTQITPQNISKTKIVGKIILNDHPTKPKKKLIIIVAFITGLILSVFLVFFIDFIKSIKEEDDAKYS